MEAGAEQRTVRLIGIDTPKTVKPATPVGCGGKEATDWMLRLTFPAPRDSDGDGLVDDENASVGARVSLRTYLTQRFTDAFGRTLAYVQVAGAIPGNRTQPYDLGVEMLLGGWAYVYVFERDFTRVESYDDEQLRPRVATAAFTPCATATSTLPHRTNNRRRTGTPIHQWGRDAAHRGERSRPRRFARAVLAHGELHPARPAPPISGGAVHDR